MKYKLRVDDPEFKRSYLLEDVWDMSKIEDIEDLALTIKTYRDQLDHNVSLVMIER